MSIIFFKRAYVVFADAPFLRIFSLFVHVSYLSLEIHDTVRIGLAHVLAHRPEGHMWVITPQIYGHIIPQKIYLKGQNMGKACLIEK